MSDDGPEHCGVGIRGIALAVDSIVWFAASFVATYAVAVPTGAVVVSDSGLDAELAGTPAVVALVLWLVLSLGYHSALEWKYGRTIGKHLVKIEVERGDGSPVTPWDAVKRNVARLVDVLPVFYLVGIVLVATSDRRRRLGDRVAGTVVVRS